MQRTGRCFQQLLGRHRKGPGAAGRRAGNPRGHLALRLTLTLAQSTTPALHSPHPDPNPNPRPNPHPNPNPNPNQASLKDTWRIIFNGDGYSAEWPVEAAKRGLANTVSGTESTQVRTRTPTLTLPLTPTLTPIDPDPDPDPGPSLSPDPTPRSSQADPYPDAYLGAVRREEHRPLRPARRDE